MGTARNIYKQFVNFEECAADIYLQLAARFSPENRDLSAFWLDMAMQEKQHAGLLQFCLAENMFSSNLPTDGEIRKFSALFQSMKKRAADPEIDVSDAFALATELETSEINAIYCHLTTPLHTSLYLLKRKIASSPSNHVECLAAEGRKFGAKVAAVKKLKGGCI